MTRDQVIKLALWGVLPVRTAVILVIVGHQQAALSVGTICVASWVTRMVDYAGSLGGTSVERRDSARLRCNQAGVVAASDESLPGSWMRAYATERPHMQIILGAADVQVSRSTSDVTSICLGRTASCSIQGIPVHVTSQSRTEKGH